MLSISASICSMRRASLRCSFGFPFGLGSPWLQLIGWYFLAGQAGLLLPALLFLQIIIIVAQIERGASFRDFQHLGGDAVDEIAVVADKSRVPSKSMRAFSKTSLLSISKWLVGSSRMRKLLFSMDSLARSSRAFPHPIAWKRTFDIIS